VKKGERVVVTGRLRIREWENGDRAGTNIDIEADALGHDLAWGTASFARSISASAANTAQTEQPPSDAAPGDDAPTPASAENHGIEPAVSSAVEPEPSLPF
jgi:single-strand DNA-binding protein